MRRIYADIKKKNDYDHTTAAEIETFALNRVGNDAGAGTTSMIEGLGVELETIQRPQEEEMIEPRLVAAVAEAHKRFCEGCGVSWTTNKVIQDFAYDSSSSSSSSSSTSESLMHDGRCRENVHQQSPQPLHFSGVNTTDHGVVVPAVYISAGAAVIAAFAFWLGRLSRH